MVTVFRSHRRYRVAVRSNDHDPPHVHALRDRLDARFKLNCPDGPVEYWDHKGPWSREHLNELGDEIAGRIDDCCKAWEGIHG